MNECYAMIFSQCRFKIHCLLFITHFPAFPFFFFPSFLLVVGFFASSNFRFFDVGSVLFTTPVDLKKLSMRPCWETFLLFWRRSIAERILSSLKKNNFNAIHFNLVPYLNPFWVQRNSIISFVFGSFQVNYKYYFQLNIIFQIKTPQFCSHREHQDSKIILVPLWISNFLADDISNKRIKLIFD